VLRADRAVDVLAPITKRASGEVAVDFHAAGRHTRFEVPVDEEKGRLRFREDIPRAQAAMGTGILTLRYPGNERTRGQEVRLRAASRHADLEVERPSLGGGRLRTQGTISRRARGVVRVQLDWSIAGQDHTYEAQARIREGRWELDSQLPLDVILGLLARDGTVHTYTLFTGYLPARMRGEMQAYQATFDDRAPEDGDGAPGRVEVLGARATSQSEVALSFLAAGSGGMRPPPARNYVVKQSLRPIRDAGDFRAAQTLCGEGCGLAPAGVGERLTLAVTDLRPKTTYYYAIAARNDAGRQGPRSQTVRVRTR
jgi:hypothetical protein